MMTQIDLNAKIVAYPYVAPSISVLANSSTGASGTSPAGATALDNLITKMRENLNILSGITLPIIGAGETIPQDKWVGVSLDTSNFKAAQVVMMNLNNAMKGLDKIITVLSKVLQIIELFTTSFGSFSKLLVAIVDYAEATVKDFVSGLQAGLYVNVLAPPAFYAKYSDVQQLLDQSRGGFNGFITRLFASLNNPNDLNRPDLSPTAAVGGFVIMIDSKDLDEIWRSLKQLSDMFDFMKLFGLNLAPPPPKGLTGRCGFFDTNFAIKLEWQSSPLATGYTIYRSKIQGGIIHKNIRYIPTALMESVDEHGVKQPGLLPVAKDMIFSLMTGSAVDYPVHDVVSYEDSDFSTYAFDTSTNSFTGEPVSLPATATSFLDLTVDPAVIRYYYVIRASSAGIQGKNSQELAVTVKTCNDSINLADIIPQPAGRIEFVSLGLGSFGSWSKIEMTHMFPWLVDLEKIVLDMLESLKGMVTDTADSFMKFIKQIKAKITLYVGILNVIKFLLGALQNFILGSSISILNVPPAIGGTQTFVNRIRKATPPPGVTFSDENGVTIGIVIMYSGGDATVAAAVKFLGKLLGIK